MLIFDVLLFLTIPVIFIMAFPLKLHAFERDSTGLSPSLCHLSFLLVSLEMAFSSGFSQNLPDKLLQIILTSHFIAAIPRPYTVYLL